MIAHVLLWGAFTFQARWEPRFQAAFTLIQSLSYSRRKVKEILVTSTGSSSFRSVRVDVVKWNGTVARGGMNEKRISDPFADPTLAGVAALAFKKFVTSIDVPVNDARLNKLRLMVGGQYSSKDRYSVIVSTATEVRRLTGIVEVIPRLRQVGPLQMTY